MRVYPVYKRNLWTNEQTLEWIASAPELAQAFVDEWNEKEPRQSYSFEYTSMVIDERPQERQDRLDLARSKLKTVCEEAIGPVYDEMVERGEIDPVEVGRLTPWG